MRLLQISHCLNERVFFWLVSFDESFFCGFVHGFIFPFLVGLVFRHAPNIIKRLV
jgi:hypothetical protein